MGLFYPVNEELRMASKFYALGTDAVAMAVLETDLTYRTFPVGGGYCLYEIKGSSYSAARKTLAALFKLVGRELTGNLYVHNKSTHGGITPFAKFAFTNNKLKAHRILNVGESYYLIKYLPNRVARTEAPYYYFRVGIPYALLPCSIKVHAHKRWKETTIFETVEACKLLLWCIDCIGQNNPSRVKSVFSAYGMGSTMPKLLESSSFFDQYLSEEVRVEDLTKVSFHAFRRIYEILVAKYKQNSEALSVSDVGLESLRLAYDDTIETYKAQKFRSPEPLYRRFFFKLHHHLDRYLSHETAVASFVEQCRYKEMLFDHVGNVLVEG